MTSPRDAAALRVVWPLTALLALAVAAVALGAELLLPGAHGPAALASATLFALAATASALALGAAAPARARDASTGAMVGALMAAAGLAGLDLVAFARANQGLRTLAELVVAEGWRGLTATLEASGVGVGLVAAVVALPLAVGAAVAWAWPRLARHGALARTTQRRHLWALLAGLFVFWLAADHHGGWARRAGRLYGAERRQAAFIDADAEPPALAVRLRERPPVAASFRGKRAPADAPRLLLVVVVESLREGAIDVATMPHLSALAAANASVTPTYAAANATHPSWYALIFGRDAHRWHSLRRGDEPAGALPLRLLRDGGYEVRVFAGAGLDYYGFGARACGADLCAGVYDASDGFRAGGRSRPALDALAIDAALAYLATPGPAQRALLVFLDGSHFPYAWPAGEAPAFAPVADADALRRGQLDASGVVGLRNRYRSALEAVDAQLGRLLAAAARSDPGYAAIVTGDHGEEFLEHGRLSHSSELCDAQLRVPLVLRLPGLATGTLAQAAGHVDVMPTLLAAVGLAEQAGAALDGEVIGEGTRIPRARMVVDATAGSPGRGALVAWGHGGGDGGALDHGDGGELGDRGDVDGDGLRLEFLFSDREDVRRSRQIYLLRVADADGRTVDGDIAATLARPAAARAFRARWGPALADHFDVTPASWAAVATAAAAEASAGEPYRVRWRRPPAAPALAQRACARVGDAPRGARFVAVEVENIGRRAWLHDTLVGRRWLDAAGAALTPWDAAPRTALPRAITPGERAVVCVAVDAAPPRSATLELDLVREEVTWFAARGNPTMRLQWPIERGD